MKNNVINPCKGEAVVRGQNMVTCVDWRVITELHLPMVHQGKCIFVTCQTENGGQRKLRINARGDLEISDKLTAGMMIKCQYGLIFHVMLTIWYGLYHIIFIKWTWNTEITVLYFRPGYERVHYKCKACEPGTYRSLRTISNQCVPCPRGYFQSARGALYCQKCPPKLDENGKPIFGLLGAKHISYCYTSAWTVAQGETHCTIMYHKFNFSSDNKLYHTETHISFALK